MTGKKDIRSENNELIKDIRRLIEKSRSTVATTVNVSLSMLYWRIGRRINQEILKESRAEYGKRILATLSQQLSWSHFRELLPLEKPLQRDFFSRLKAAPTKN